MSGAKPVTVGQGYSTIAIVPETEGSWALPLLTQVAGYQAVSALHLNSRAIVHDEVCGCASRNRH